MDENKIIPEEPVLEAEVTEETAAAPEASQTAEAPETPAEPAAQNAEEAADEDSGEATVAKWNEVIKTAEEQRDAAMKKAEELSNDILRTRAEFQNTRRESGDARTKAYDAGLRAVLEALVPAMNELHTLLDGMDAKDPMAKGVQMTVDQLENSLNRFGYAEISRESKGGEADEEVE